MAGIPVSTGDVNVTTLPRFVPPRIRFRAPGLDERAGWADDPATNCDGDVSCSGRESVCLARVAARCELRPSCSVGVELQRPPQPTGGHRLSKELLAGAPVSVVAVHRNRDVPRAGRSDSDRPSGILAV